MSGFAYFFPIFFFRWTDEIKAAFRKHIDTYGGLDICINCAGIGSSIPFDEDRTDGGKSWRLTVNVNLIAVIGCTQIAVCF